MNEIETFIKKYNGELTCGNIIATHDGERKFIGKVVDGVLVKLIMEDVNESYEEKPKRTRKAAQEVTDVEVTEQPVSE
jgi:hypothetical protein